MARSDMRDFEWDFIEKLLPNKSRGVKRVDDRRVINGILYALRTGIPWRDMPEQYGPWSTIYNRFNRWSKAGIWDMIFEAIVDSHNVDTVMVDSTSVRAHPTAAKLKKTDKRRCLGRSRGGLGTKIHASNNQDGLPLKLELTPNQANDAPPCETLLTGLQPGKLGWQTRRNATNNTMLAREKNCASSILALTEPIHGGQRTPRHCALS